MAATHHAHVFCLGVAFVVSLVMVVVSVPWILTSDLLGGPQAGINNSHLTTKMFTGVILECVFLPLMFTLGGAFSIGVYKLQAAERSRAVQIAKCALFATLAGLSLWGIQQCWDSQFGKAGKVLSCGILGCYKATDLKQDDNKLMWQIPIGTEAIFPTVLIAVLELVLLARTALGGPAPGTQGKHPQGSINSKDDVLAESQVSLINEQPTNCTCRPSSVSPPPVPTVNGVEIEAELILLGKAAVTLGFVLFMWLLTTWVPQNWEGFYPTSLKAYVSTKITTAEWDDAVFKTANWTLEKGKLILHLFPDTTMYYMFLLFVSVVGLASQFSPRFGKLLQRRFLLVEDKPPPKWWWAWFGAPPLSISVGAIVVLSAFVVLVVCFLIYWGHDHAYHAGEKMTDEQIAARTLGQLANLIMGLMLFPVSKNSILTFAFGIAWEQVIFVHVLLGQSLLVVIFIHMLMWWKVYAQQDAFPEDILQVPMWFPTNSNCQYSDDYNNKQCFKDWHATHDPHSDNFTIQMATVTSWIMFVVFGIFAQNWMRRRNYELFYYLHHFYLVVFFVTLLHAASAWYYLFGGLALWFVDRCIRTMQRTRRWEMTVMRPLPRFVTHLELTPFDDEIIKASGPFNFQCGQYLYLNIPEISSIEWHPFTISSAPSDGKVTCDIKMAPGGTDTFTGKLHMLASTTSNSTAVQVNIDGPYGEWFDHTKFDKVLLLAGGIGVTPTHSIFRQLRHEILYGSCQLSEVHWVWCVQTLADLEPCLHTIREVAADSIEGRLKVSIYVDNEKLQPGEANINGMPVTEGRAPVPALVSDLAESSKGLRPHVFVCGPPGLAAGADLACLKHNVSFHKEVFAF